MWELCIPAEQVIDGCALGALLGSDDGCALGVLLGSDDGCALGVLLTTPWLQSCGLVTSLVLS